MKYNFQKIYITNIYIYVKLYSYICLLIYMFRYFLTYFRI